MVTGILTGLYVTPVILRIATHFYQKGKAKKEAIKNLEDLGYDVNKHYINKIFYVFNTEEEKNKYEGMNDLKWTFLLIPFANLFSLPIDIKYLSGDHTNEPYWDEFSSISDKKIEYLLTNGVISENDSEKQLYEKLEQLQEMILRKQTETSNNDVKNLEYKNKEGNKYEKI